MNNDSLIETENSGRGLVLHFVDFSIFFIILCIYFLFLPKRYSSKIVVPRFNFFFFKKNNYSL